MSKRIEELIKQAETVKQESLKKALERHIEAEQKKEEELLLSQFQQASRVLDIQVDKLRRARAVAKQYEKSVKNTDAALEQFKKDGNYDAFLTVVRKN